MGCCLWVAACGSPAPGGGEGALVDADADGVLSGADCDDDDASVGLPTTGWTDADSDGLGDPAAPVTACNLPSGVNADVVGNSIQADQGWSGFRVIENGNSTTVVNTSFVDNTLDVSAGARGMFVSGDCDPASCTSAIFEFDYSNMYGNAGAPADFAWVRGSIGASCADTAGCIEQDPGYLDTSAVLSADWDLRLAAGSALVDAGDPASSTPTGASVTGGLTAGPQVHGDNRHP